MRGSLPPLVLGRDGSVRRLDKGGTVVGLMDGMHYEEDRFLMQPGDILVAYSDGVTEPENDFGEFGEERLMEVVSAISGSAAACDLGAGDAGAGCVDRGGGAAGRHHAGAGAAGLTRPLTRLREVRVWP